MHANKVLERGLTVGVANYYKQLSCDCHDYQYELGIEPGFFYVWG